MFASFVGDWYDAAMLHRAWALRNASWTSQGNLSTRAATEPGYPRWVLHTPFWANCVGYDCYLNLSRGIHPNVVDNNVALRKLLGISSLALEFAKWNEEPWDWGFPNFTARNLRVSRLWQSARLPERLRLSHGDGRCAWHGRVDGQGRWILRRHRKVVGRTQTNGRAACCIQGASCRAAQLRQPAGMARCSASTLLFRTASQLA